MNDLYYIDASRLSPAIGTEGHPSLVPPWVVVVNGPVYTINSHLNDDDRAKVDKSESAAVEARGQADQAKAQDGIKHMEEKPSIIDILINIVPTIH